MKDILKLYELHGPRLELAIDQLVNGMGFIFEDIWFRTDGNTLRCEAVNPSILGNINDNTAMELIRHAQTAFKALSETSATFMEISSKLRILFAVIDDIDTTTIIRCEFIDGILLWH